MSKPVATIGDEHTCPHHRGGPVVDPGQSHVTIDGLPVAVVGGSCVCGRSRSDGMVVGAATVRINGKSIMRVGDATSHGGAIVTGKASVTIA